MDCMGAHLCYAKALVTSLSQNPITNLFNVSLYRNSIVPSFLYFLSATEKTVFSVTFDGTAYKHKHLLRPY